MENGYRGVPGDGSVVPFPGREPQNRPLVPLKKAEIRKNFTEQVAAFIGMYYNKNEKKAEIRKNFMNSLFWRRPCSI